MMYKIGWIDVAYWDKKMYRVQFRDQYPVFARVLDTGSNEPLNIEDQVLCLYDAQTNWIILGRVPTAEKYTLADNDKSEEQRLLEQQRKLIGDYVAGETNAGAAEPGSADDGIPNYYPEDEEPLGFGDTQIRSRESGSFIRADSSGNILAVVSDILCSVMDTFRNGLLHRAKEYLLDVIPGFRMKIHARPQQNAPAVPASPTPSTQPAHMTIEATLASDPDKNQIDFDLEAGALRDIDDPTLGKGRASETKPYKVKRGARLRLGDFGVLEVDNDVDETRLSFGFGDDPLSLYQLRFNPKEATLSWGLEQFISLTKEGLLIKAKTIGLAGPLIMWDPTKTATFMHNQDLTKADLGAVIEWDVVNNDGIKINKSIYFGDKGDPAVTKPYLEQVFLNFVDLNDKHTHIASGFGAPTGTPIIPLKPIVEPFLKEPLVDTFLTIVKKPATPST